MSAKKVTDTKIPDDSELDSGVCSGPIYQWPESADSGLISSEMSSEIKSEEKKVPSVYVESEYDSGVLEVFDDFTNLSLDPKTVVPPPPTDTKATSALPPLYVLFKQDDDGDT